MDWIAELLTAPLLDGPGEVRRGGRLCVGPWRGTSDC
jgi:hypothetical protein